MSTIIAVEKAGQVVVAWDSGRHCHDTRLVHTLGPPKVLAVRDSYIGTAGFTVYYSLLDDYIAGLKRTPALSDERAILRFFVDFSRALRSDYHFVNDEWDEDNPSPFADLGNEFLVVNAHGLFVVREILSVTRFARFCVIGSGAPHAEGALQALYELDLDAREIARRAMDVAIMLDLKSAGPYEIREIARSAARGRKPAGDGRGKRARAKRVDRAGGGTVKAR